MIGPRRERCALLLFVDRTIVDTGESSLVAADMVQHRFDDMRRDAKLGHAGRGAAAQIMLRPVIELRPSRGEAGVEFPLASRPGCEGPCAAKDEVAVLRLLGGK